MLGGACVTEEVWPGYKVSTAAYVNSLLRPEVIRDLELKRHGLLYSQRGRGGGYGLAKSAEAITFGQVVRIIDGPFTNFTGVVEDLPKNSHMTMAMVARFDPKTYYGEDTETFTDPAQVRAHGQALTQAARTLERAQTGTRPPA